MVKCKNCGYLAVRHLEAQELVGMPDFQRENGHPPESNGTRVNLDRTPICSMARCDLRAELDGSPNVASVVAKVVNASRDCDRFRQRIPLLTPKEHLDMDMFDRQQAWQQAESDRAERRHRQGLWQSLGVALFGAAIALSGVVLKVYLDQLASIPPRQVSQPVAAP